MPSKKASAPAKSSAASKSTAKPAAKPAAKAPAKPAAKAPAKPSTPPAKSTAKVETKSAKPAPAKSAPAKAPPPPAKPAGKPKPIPFTIKNERAQPPSKSAKAPPPKIELKGQQKQDQPRPSPYGPKAKYTVMTADAMAASRAAAAKLAAAAGLMPVKNTSNGDAPARNYTRVTKTPFNKKELEEFREMLLIKRRQIEGDVNAMESEALTGGGSGGALSHLPQHMADQGTDTFDQSLALDLAASQRGLLKEIDDALARIENNTYGVCEEMGKPIGVERLRHTPWARFCIEAARQHERAAYFR